MLYWYSFQHAVFPWLSTCCIGFSTCCIVQHAVFSTCSISCQHASFSTCCIFSTCYISKTCCLVFNMLFVFQHAKWNWTTHDLNSNMLKKKQHVKPWKIACWVTAVFADAPGERHNVTSGNSEKKCGDCGDPKDSLSMLQTNHKGKDKEGGVYYYNK